MPIQAQIEGIGTLEFPDGTSNDVIQATVKRAISERSQQGAVSPQGVGSQQQLQQAVQEAGQVGQRQLMTGAYMPSVEPENVRQDIGALTTTAGRVVPPLVAAGMTGGLSIPASMGANAFASAIGEAVGQTIEKMFGRREDYSGREIAASAVSGAAPILQGGGFLKPLGNVAMQAAGGIAGETVRTGEVKPEAGLVPAALTAAFQVPGAIAAKTGKEFEQAAQRAESVEKIGQGVEPTFGQAMPRFAGLESRIESRAGMPAVTEQLARQGEQIKTAVQSLTGVAAEGADKITRKLLGALNSNEIDDIANASRNLKDAETILESARGEAQKQAQKRAVDQARKEYEDVINNTLFKGQTISPFRVVPAGQQIESLANQAKEAIRAESKRLYGKANQVENVEAFDLFSAPQGKSSFASDANELLRRIPDIPAGGLSEVRKILSRRQTVAAPPSLNPTAPLTISVPQKATFKELQGIRDELYDFADYAGEAIGSKAQAEVKNLAKKISETISDQAPSALGQEAANSIIAGEQFYGATRPTLDLFGVRRAFAPETMEKGQMGKALVSGVKAQGLLAPEFANLERVVNTLKSRNVPNTPDIQETLSSIKSGIVSDVTDKSTNAIDYKKLAETLNNIETQSPGALQKIGFGTPDQLSKFMDFLQSTSQKSGPEALLDILNTKTPAGFAIASEAVQLLPNVKDIGSVVRYLERQSVAGNKMAKDALLSIRSREIEDILLAETAIGGTGPSMKAISKIKGAEQILGPTLYKQIVNDIIPGYKTILNAQRAAGNAGIAVTGQAAEELVSGVPQAAIKALSGKASQGIMGVISDAVNAGFYSVAAKALARASGSAGYRSAADTAKIFERFSNIPRESLYDALSKYAETGELPK